MPRDLILFLGQSNMVGQTERCRNTGLSPARENTGT